MRWTSPSKKEIKETLAQIAKADDESLRAKVWQLEAQTRYGASPDENTIKTTLADADSAGDAYSSAVARRTFGLWQTGGGNYEAARGNLEKAVIGFRRQRDPYEAARTQVDLARTHLLMKVTAPGDSTNRYGHQPGAGGAGRSYQHLSSSGHSYCQHQRQRIVPLAEYWPRAAPPQTGCDIHPRRAHLGIVRRYLD